MANENLVKVNFTTAPDVKSWYKEEASKLGITMSGFMSIVLAQYKQQTEARNTLSEFTELNKSMTPESVQELLTALNAFKGGES